MRRRRLGMAASAETGTASSSRPFFDTVVAWPWRRVQESVHEDTGRPAAAARARFEEVRVGGHPAPCFADGAGDDHGDGRHAEEDVGDGFIGKVS